jgi:hypothetical protein
MRHPNWVLIGLLPLLALLPRISHAQYIYVDVTGDGACDEFDVLAGPTTSISVFLDTTRDQNDTAVSCGQDPSTGLSVSSYAVLLVYGRAGVTFGDWADSLGFPVDLGTARDAGYLWVARGSTSALPPGKYKLGSVPVSIAGEPYVCIAASRWQTPSYYTGFGSDCAGMDGDHVLKLGSDFAGVCCTAIFDAAVRTTWGLLKSRYQ